MTQSEIIYVIDCATEPSVFLYYILRYAPSCREVPAFQRVKSAVQTTWRAGLRSCSPELFVNPPRNLSFTTGAFHWPLTARGLRCLHFTRELTASVILNAASEALRICDVLSASRDPPGP